LEACRTPELREDLAARTGISSKLILEWANAADLLRIAGMRPEYADRLEAAGVDTVVELAKRNPESVHQALKDKYKDNGTSWPLPELEQVKGWVNQAKMLPRMLAY
jgi:predicted flap endonuclease-1-like 5' DNA nuclease